MIISFIWGVIIGVLSGAAAVLYWAYRAGKKRKDQEVNEVPEPAVELVPEQKPLDITTQLAIDAYNILHQYCKQQVGCQFGCPFKENICGESFYEEPDVWPELEVPDV